jgi:drug/metabolite transporter (DMT)-like permease
MTDNARGILAMLIGSTAFVMGDAMVKLVTAELPGGEIIVIRGVLATALLAIGVVAMRAMRPISVLLTPMMIVRLVTAAGATIFVVLTLRYLPLATVNCVVQFTPLAVTAGAALVWGERVGWQRWLAAFTGFLGVVLIVKPGGSFGAAAYLALTTLMFTTIRDLSTRGLPRDVPSILVAAASAVVITLGGFLVAPLDAAWSMPSGRAWLCLCVAASCLFVANTLLIVGFRTGEIGVVAPFRYVPVLLSILLGWWFWGDLPDAVAFVGIGLVLAAGLYMLHRERPSLVSPTPAPQRS